MRLGDQVMFWLDPLLIYVGSILVFLVFSWVLEKFADFIGYTED